MSRRPVQDVRIWNVQDRSSRPEARKPFIVRRVVDGREHSKPAFSTWADADGYRSRLLVARADGERFDPRTGEPESWAPTGEETQLHQWARLWVAEHWEEWQPHTRTNELDGLVRFIPLLVGARAPKPPRGLRAYLRETLPPGAELEPDHQCERWLDRWVLELGELSRRNLAEAIRMLGIGDNGRTLKSETARRYRRTARACVRRSVELEYLPEDPWPPTPRGRARRKVNRVNLAVDLKRLHGPATVVKVIDNMASHQPESRRWQVMTAVVFYAGLRPSEVAYLRPNDLYLPEEGWGSIVVDETDDGEDSPAAPKSGGRRRVPIPPRLVRLLSAWLEDHDLKPDDLLFRTKGNRRPSQSNWGRALRRAHKRTGVHHIPVYDYRHAAATLWIRNGMPLPEAAKRLGDEVTTLVAYYIDAMEGDELAGNAAVDRALAGTRDEILAGRAGWGKWGTRTETNGDARREKTR